MQGTTNVIRLMEDWKDISEFGEYIEEIIHSHEVSMLPQLSPEDMAWLLNDIYVSLRQLEPYVYGREEELKGLGDLILFVRTLAAYIPPQSADEQFELLHPLRSWLFFLPISFSKRAREDKDVMILLAYFYAVALAVEPLFPAVGAAWFGSLAVGPIREIHRSLLQQRQNMDPLELQKCWPITLMSFPLEVSRAFHIRMGLWRADEVATQAYAAQDHSSPSVSGWSEDITTDVAVGITGVNKAFNIRQLTNLQVEPIDKSEDFYGPGLWRGWSTMSN